MQRSTASARFTGTGASRSLLPRLLLAREERGPHVGGLALDRDVGDDAHEAGQGRALQHRIHQHPKPARVALQVEGLPPAAPLHLGGRRRLVASPELPPDLGPGATDQVRGRAREQGRERVVEPRDGTVRREQADAVADGVEGGLPAATGRAQPLLGATEAQQRVDRGQQHRRLDRIGEVAVRAALVGEILGPVAQEGGRDVHDRYRQRALLGPQPPTHLEAVHVRQVHVEEDQVGPPLAREAEGLGAVAGLQHLEACAPEHLGARVGGTATGLQPRFRGENHSSRGVATGRGAALRASIRPTRPGRNDRRETLAAPARPIDKAGVSSIIPRRP
jgi:hypothetical protein